MHQKSGGTRIKLHRGKSKSDLHSFVNVVSKGGTGDLLQAGRTQTVEQNVPSLFLAHAVEAGEHVGVGLDGDLCVVFAALLLVYGLHLHPAADDVEGVGRGLGGGTAQRPEDEEAGGADRAEGGLPSLLESLVDHELDSDIWELRGGIQGRNRKKEGCEISLV